MAQLAALQRIVVSAPGKVILHGEHAVVYGKRGVAVSLDLRTTLTLTRNNDAVVLDMPDISMKESWSLASVQRLYDLLKLTNCRANTDEVKSLTPANAVVIKEFLCIHESSKTQRTLALLSFFHLYTSLLTRVEGFTVHVSSQIPTGAGLGSSAAYAVCLTGAMLVLSGRVSPTALLLSTKEELRRPAVELANKWTYTSEAIMHGTSSGIDNTTCSFGGVISFKDGDISTLGTCGLQMMLVNTKVPRSTQALVSSVRERVEKYPLIMNPILDAMDALAEQALLILKQLSEFGVDDDDLINSDESQAEVDASLVSSLYGEIGELMNLNHQLLGALGVSHPSLEKVLEVATEHHLNGKLTGAGGGGFALVLVPRRRKRESFRQCTDALKSLGCQVWMVDLGVPGLAVHTAT